MLDWILDAFMILGAGLALVAVCVLWLFLIGLTIVWVKDTIADFKDEKAKRENHDVF